MYVLEFKLYIYDMENIVEIIKECYNKSELCNKLGLPLNGNGFRKVNNLIEINNLDITHFDIKKKSRKYKIIKKNCPVCKSLFKTKEGHRDEKTTCSNSCANTHFRTGENNPNWKETSSRYREICFNHHDKKCVVCDECIMVEVHHYDGNHENDHPTNLIPICSTHHRYWHSRHRYLIFEKVENYKNNFENKYSETK